MHHDTTTTTTTKTMRTRARRWSGLMLLASLAACGGGGGGDDTAGNGSGGTTPPVTVDPLLQRRLSLRTAAELGGVVPADVNNGGTVLGTRTPAGGRSAATLWSNGQAVAVKVPACEDANAEAVNCLSLGLRLNDAGQVLVAWSDLWEYSFVRVQAGQAWGGPGSSEGIALAADGTVLAALGPQQINALVHPVSNDRLDVLALIPDADSRPYPVYFPADLNNAGRAVGTVSFGKAEGNAISYGMVEAGYVFDQASASTRLLPGTTAKPGSAAAAVNDAGVVVGSVFVKEQAETTASPVRWSAALAPELLPCPDGLGVAQAVRKDGAIAGRCGASGPSARGVLWGASGTVDVNTLLDEASRSAGWVVRSVRRLNDQGWMIADAARGSGDAEPVLLKPAAD